MNTAQLSQQTGVPAHTIRRVALELDGLFVGGSRGWIFDDSAPGRLRRVLNKRASKFHKACKDRAAEKGAEQ